MVFFTVHFHKFRLKVLTYTGEYSSKVSSVSGDNTPCRYLVTKIKLLDIFIDLCYHISMLIRKGYKFRLKLREGEDAKLRQFAGCCRFVWNKGLEYQDNLFRDKNCSLLSKTRLLNLLSDMKREFPFLDDVHSQILQQTLIDLNLAYQNFFRKLKKIQNEDFSEGEKSGYPQFKRKFQQDSFRFPQGFKITNRQIYLPKLG